MIDVRVQAGDFDPGRQLARLSELPGSGIAGFVGKFCADEAVSEIIVEHYAALAKTELRRIAEEAEQSWPLNGAILIHRHGRLLPGDRVFFAAAASPDPGAAAEACAFLVKGLRGRAPFWRKDVLQDGGSRWFAAGALIDFPVLADEIKSFPSAGGRA